VQLKEKLLGGSRWRRKVTRTGRARAGVKLLPGWCRVQHDVMIDARNNMKKIRPKESSDLHKD
jgi:hypothetical protein